MNKSSNHWKIHPGEVPVIGTMPRGNPMHRTMNGFTVLELLVVVAMVGLLIALIMPALGSSRASSSRAACASNLRQLALANIAYAADHGYFVAAASDIRGRNTQRWHGTRSSGGDAFDPANGPLSPYFGRSRQVKQCPAFHPEREGFEHGCGGYGYNAAGVGSQAYLRGARAGAVMGMPVGAIARASETIMFTDAAFLQGDELIEYSFAEPVFHISGNAPPRETSRAWPSIHFRHDGYANVAWADGHVTSEPMSNEFNQAFSDVHIGWFGPSDNTLFDPY